MDRFASTTEHLRDVGRALLVELGPRSFTQEALAERGYVAVGTVYQRWSSRVDTLVDLAESRLLPALQDFETGTDALFDSVDGRALLRFTSDVLLAARDHPELQPATHEAVRLLKLVAVPHATVDQDLHWWFTSCAVGWGMLLAGHADLPPIADLVGRVGQRPTSSVERAAAVATGSVESILPTTPPTEPTDSKGEILKAAARDLLTTKARPGFNTRDITEEAGVSTGSMYRRFPSRSELLRALLVDEVQSQRYEWTADMVNALTGSDPLPAAADVITQVLSKVFDDRDAQRLILELTVAARSEQTLRTQLVGQIAAAVESRRELFSRFSTAGILAPSVPPDQLSWVFQAPPIGARLLGALGERPSDDDLRGGIESLLRSFLVD